jgi:hypothetical protein
VLSERERRIIAQIEAHIRREEPRLAHLLAHGTRLTLLRHPEPGVIRALTMTMTTMLFGMALFLSGLSLASPPLVVTGLAVAMIGPLPAWLVATAPRTVRYRS